jgi:DNA-binding transcriptional MocR family regulator
MVDSGGGVNHFAALVAAQFCISGRFEQHAARLRSAYRARRDALLAGLQAHLPPGCEWTRPGGGYFIWVRLPDGLAASTLLPYAEAAGVAYLPGRLFHLDGRGDAALRLAFSLYGEEELAEGARRLGAAIYSALGRTQG